MDVETTERAVRAALNVAGSLNLARQNEASRTLGAVQQYLGGSGDVSARVEWAAALPDGSDVVSLESEERAREVCATWNRLRKVRDAGQVYAPVSRLVVEVASSWEPAPATPPTCCAPCVDGEHATVEDGTCSCCGARVVSDLPAAGGVS